VNTIGFEIIKNLTFLKTPYKKKFMICRKCDTKRETLPHEKGQRETLLRQSSYYGTPS
jgi:hypothetical protein